MFTVYVIYSQSHNVFYKGMTEDLERRLFQHNNGLLGNYTKNKAPWRLVYSETFLSKSDALKREKYFKTGAGRDFLKSKIIL
ncbi:MAG: GIY-YIG nuclease family protein [Bacteroidia bacterium]|nr:GIY-YIG nuclease family protein [Bacteroidia bacterium]MBP7714899.1 GIY-YIG nuclease family protein [Bacteroidia bacterium]MBP7714900.1 GIY-YIG nuclease family protein [Bacteroidia bacterium]MBP8668283.1 GIY-YIG nuclease family protein [Bacteroidia bacterium]MBP8668284.1 GIY-YIG nuclease family protein [Bacteroidia bacterium]